MNGICHLCQETGPLTQEHTPPKKAFNNDSMVVYNFFLEKQRECQNGFKNYTLCGRCNNNTGSWYGGSYVDFAKQCAGFLETQANKIEIYNVYPLRIIKQILIMFICTLNPEFISCHSGLQRFLLNKENRDIPKDIMILSALHSQDYSLNTGIIGETNLKTNNTSIYANMMHWPLRYQMIIGNDSRYDKVNILKTIFNCSFYEKRNLNIELITN